MAYKFVGMTNTILDSLKQVLDMIPCNGLAGFYLEFFFGGGEKLTSNALLALLNNMTKENKLLITMLFFFS